MKKFWMLVLMATSLAVGWMFGGWCRGWRYGGEAVSYHTGPTIEQVQALSCLVTQRVDVADVQETRLEGYMGGMKAALLVKGDFLLGVDLSKAKFESVDPAGHRAVLVLPQPRVTSPRLDQDRTRLFTISESGLWLIAPGAGPTSTALINRAYRDAQHLIAGACDEPSLMIRGRQQAERVLKAFFDAVGWTVEVRWAE
jgi:hypothetical protein